jgi:cell division protein FtsQ
MPRLMVAAGSPPVGAGLMASLRGSPAVYAAAGVLRELPAGLARQVAEVAAADPSDVTLTLADGITIVWGSTDRAAEKVKELGVLMHTHARSYDVSAPGTAVTGG